MGGKKGIWTFSLHLDQIICQSGPRPGSPPWTTQQLEDGKMVYRLDRILNPETSSALPMFAIDRSYPIVSRRFDGSQCAHLNMELNERKMSWKIGEEKQPSISFDEIASGHFTFNEKIAALFAIPKEALNQKIQRVCKEIHLLDAMYKKYIRSTSNLPNTLEEVAKLPLDG